jgi:hypothetical protein
MTRDEWRPGRRSATAPPRQRNWGGAQELSLALATSQRRIGAPGAPPACAHCRRLAMRGLTVCRWHGGASIAARRAKARARRQGEGEGEGEGEGTCTMCLRVRSEWGAGTVPRARARARRHARARARVCLRPRARRRGRAGARAGVRIMRVRRRGRAGARACAPPGVCARAHGLGPGAWTKFAVSQLFKPCALCKQSGAEEVVMCSWLRGQRQGQLGLSRR